MREWLELTEKAVYLCNNENTYYTKNLDCRSYVGGKWSWLGLPNLMTGKGSKRWQQVKIPPKNPRFWTTMGRTAVLSFKVNALGI